MSAILKQPEHFSQSLDSEFFTVRSLSTVTGVDPSCFGNVVIKELVDNALDAAEAKGVNPVIHLDIHEIDEHTLQVSVTDNGYGLNGDTVRKLADFSNRTSDKATRRLPSRGAQGNATLTIIGIAALSGGTVSYESRGFKHTVKPTYTPAGHEIHISTGASDIVDGCKVTVIMRHYEVDLNWLARFSLYNPHGQFVQNGVLLENRIGNSPCTESAESAGFVQNGVLLENRAENSPCTKAAEFSKRFPNDPTSIHWYQFDEFWAYLYKTGRDYDKPIGEFIGQFHGLKRTAIRKQVAATIPAKRTSEVTEDEARVLFDAMRKAAKELPPKALGAIGKDYWLSYFGETKDSVGYWYKRTEFVIGGVPYLFECMAIDNDGAGFYSAINHSPTNRDFTDTIQVELGGRSFKGATGAKDAILFPFTFAIHLVCPSLNFRDKGKTSLVLPYGAQREISKALAGSLKDLHKLSEDLRKDAAKAEKKKHQAAQKAKSEKISNKQAVLKMLAYAIVLATSGRSLPASIRNVFYQIRPLIQQFNTSELTYDNFCTIVKDHWLETGEPDPSIYFDARGVLYEPHTGVEVPIGTLQIKSYRVPGHLYNKILFVEKKGLWQTMKAARLAERYDMAILASEGYAVEAAKDLLALAQDHCTVFVLHDCDVDGYNIARTLTGETKYREANKTINVVDLGLTVQAAIDMGLGTESFTRKKALPSMLELDGQELEWFTGVPVLAGKNKKGEPNYHYKNCQRVELNAMSAGEFIKFIEDGIDAHIADRKLIPPDDVLDEKWLSVVKERLDEEITGQLKTALGVSAFIDGLASGIKIEALSDAVKDHFEDEPTDSWCDAISSLVGDEVAGMDLKEGIDGLIANHII